jgi:hypothetical protein
MKPSSFKDLMIGCGLYLQPAKEKVRGMVLAKTVHTLTRKFPRVRALLGACEEKMSERYGLSAQMHSAATSVPLNIAEGQCLAVPKNSCSICPMRRDHWES